MSNLFPCFINKMEDKIMFVRRRFCLVAEKIMLNFFSTTKKGSDEDKEQKFTVINAFDKLKNDFDEEVSEQAYDSESRFLTKYKDLSEEEYSLRYEREFNLA